MLNIRDIFLEHFYLKETGLSVINLILSFLYSSNTCIYFKLVYLNLLLTLNLSLDKKVH